MKTFKILGSYVVMAIVIFISEVGLFMLDHESDSLSDVLELRELQAFVLYFIPTFIITAFFFNNFWKNQQVLLQLTYSLLLSIPIGFTLIIVTLSLLMA